MSLSVIDTFDAGPAVGHAIFFDTPKQTFSMQVTVFAGSSSEVSLEGTIDGTNWLVLINNNGDVITLNESKFYTTTGQYVTGARTHCVGGGTGVTAALIAVD